MLKEFELDIDMCTKMFIGKLFIYIETLPKALQTQALTALTSNFGRFGRIGLVW